MWMNCKINAHYSVTIVNALYANLIRNSCCSFSVDFPHFFRWNNRLVSGKSWLVADLFSLTRLLFYVLRKSTYIKMRLCNNSQSYRYFCSLLRFYRIHLYSIIKVIQLHVRYAFILLTVYKIWRGPLHEEATADIEWVYRPYMNTTFKRRFLSEPPSPWTLLCK